MASLRQPVRVMTAGELLVVLRAPGYWFASVPAAWVGRR
jgi:hypothetical protein